MLHIKLKGMTNAATCNHIFFSLHAPSTPEMRSMAKTFFLKVLMLHTKLIRTGQRAPCKHIFSLYTQSLAPRGQKIKKKSESTVPCCISNKSEWSVEHHARTFPVLTHTLDQWGRIKRSTHFFLNVVMLHIKLKGKKCRPTYKNNFDLTHWNVRCWKCTDKYLFNWTKH